MLFRYLAVLILLHVQGLWFAVIDINLNSETSNEANSIPFFETNLDSDDKIHLYWTVDYDEETVNFEARVRASDHDWVAIGFSDRGAINNADFCVLWTDKKRNNKLQVHFVVLYISDL